MRARNVNLFGERVRLTMDADGQHLFLGDHDIAQSVRSVDIHIAAHDVATVRIELFPESVDVDIIAAAVTASRDVVIVPPED